MTLRIITLLFVLGATARSATPTISTGGILNAASRTPFGLPNSGIAQGSMFLVMGQNLGPTWVQFAPSLPLSTSLGGVTLNVTVGSTSLAPYLVYVSATQIGAIMPSNTPVGAGTLKVTYGGATSSPAIVQVVRNAPGILTLNGSGYGPAAMLNYNSPSDQPVNTAIEAAHPSQIGILWGAGLGPITTGDSVPPPVAMLPFDIQLLVGGKAAKVQYAGRSPEFPGIDQINFEIPAGVAGCHVPIALKVEGVVSNYATIAVASSGKTCSDWQGFSASEIASDAALGAILLGQTRMTLSTPSGSGSSVGEDVSAMFFRRPGADALYGIGPRDAGVMLGSCVVHGMKAPAAVQWMPYTAAGAYAGVDAGASLVLTGPNGQTQIAPQATGRYANPLGGAGGSPYLAEGRYSVTNGTGSADIGAFRAELTVPAAVTWTNAGGLKEITRAQPLDILWSGGDASKEFVIISGAAMDVTNQALASFTCAERAGAGKFTVPAEVLSSLPAASSWTSGGYPAGTLSLGTMPILSSVRFSAPGLDAGYFAYSRQQLINVTYK
jgi:uncharacterized protein (TIGR03437 family)